MVVFVDSHPIKKMFRLLCEGVVVLAHGFVLNIQNSRKRETIASIGHAAWGKSALLSMMMSLGLLVEGFLGDIYLSRNWIEDLKWIFRVLVVSTMEHEIGDLDVTNRCGPIALFKGVEWDANDAIADLNQLSIRRDFSNAEVVLDAPRMADSVRRMVAA